VLLPPLRRLSAVLTTKSHLYENIAPARLDSLMAGIGRDWASLLGTLFNMYNQFNVYVGPLESLAGRWAEERFDLLQPDSPGLHNILVLLIIEQIKDVAAKDMQLVGASSGSCTAAGNLDFTKREAAPAGDDGEKVET
jgi:hypothetical protein